MKLFSRSHIALFLTVIYTLIMMSPTVQCAMRSASVAQALTGECTGYCGTCGCSPEQTASHTCCCWQNKQDADYRNKTKNNGAAVTTVSCPCGSGKLLVLWSSENDELLPYQFIVAMPHPTETMPHHNISHHMTSSHDEPPDPPPKLSLLFMCNC